MKIINLHINAVYTDKIINLEENEGKLMKNFVKWTI